MSDPIDLEYTIGETPGALALLPATSDSYVFVPREMLIAAQARIAEMDQAANDGAARIAELHADIWNQDQAMHAKDIRIADLSHALEMEHQLLDEARLQIEGLQMQCARHIGDLLHYAADVCPDQDRIIAEQQSLLRECLAALIAASPDYRNDELIARVRAEAEATGRLGGGA